MKLYLVHCGFYDSDLCDGVYESHVNFFAAASDFSDARAKVKKHPEFHKKKMHIDGLQEIETVDGHRVVLNHDPNLRDETRIISHRHRDLAPKKEPGLS